MTFFHVIPLIFNNVVLWVSYGLSLMGCIHYGPNINKEDLPPQYKIKNGNMFVCGNCEFPLYSNSKKNVETYFKGDKQVCYYCYHNNYI